MTDNDIFDYNNQTDCENLAQLLFSHVTTTCQECFSRYPKRQLPEGAKVTRFAPSPTGFLHFGGLFPIMVSERLAHLSGGVFYLRIEDTDQKREVKGATNSLIRTLSHYGIKFDEGVTIDGEIGAYAPYKQSARRDIYHIFAKQLVASGKAYPCFTSNEELKLLMSKDKKEEIKSKNWRDETQNSREETMKMRSFSLADVKNSIAKGEKFVLRVRSEGDGERKIKINDIVKGLLEMPENDEVFVLLKSDGIPTYHFAHVVDDTLMGTTHVVRGEEWLPSLPKHIMLFKYLSLPAPKYLHMAQIMKLENGSKKKLSKRDMGANMEDYKKLGFTPDSVVEYILTLLNSNYEEWHAQNPEKSYTDFAFSTKKMSTSGCLFDYTKLNDVAKNVLSKYTATQIYDGVLAWANEYDKKFYEILLSDKDYAISIFSIGRGGKKPRKDFGAWSEVKDYMGFFYDEYFDIVEPIPSNFSKSDICSIISDFSCIYDENDDQNSWFEKIKSLAEKYGYTCDMKAYKTDPTAFKGSVADVSMFLRVAVSGRQSSPDMYELMHILGKEKVCSRLLSLSKMLK